MIQTVLRAVSIAGAIVLLFGVTASSAKDEHDHETSAPLPVLSANQEKLARSLETEFIAPCCWHQPISVHDSQIAKTMRAEIRQMIADGLTAEEIRQHYIAQYGEQIMSVPYGGGFNHFAWIVPFVAGVFGVVIAGSLLRSWRRVKSDAKRQEPQSGTDDERYAKVDAQLREWSD